MPSANEFLTSEATVPEIVDRSAWYGPDHMGITDWIDDRLDFQMVALI